MKYLISILLTLQLSITNGQQIFIPYQSQSKWGLADTTGKVVLTPEYDAIEFEEFTNYSKKDMYFFAIKNKKRGVLLNKKIIIPTKFDYIGINQKFIICNTSTPNSSNSVFLYTLFGKQLNTTPFKEIDQIYHDEDNYFYPTFLIKNTGTSFSLAYVDSAKGLVFLVKNAFAITKLGKYFSIQQFKKDKIKNAVIIKNSSNGIKLKNIEINIEDDINESSVTSAPDEMGNSKINESFFIKENGFWKTIKSREYTKNEKPFDFTKYDTAYEIRDLSFSLYYEDEDGTTKYYKNLLLSKTVKGYGVLFPDGKSISNNYDSIELFKSIVRYNAAQDYSGILFKVMKNGKYGLINQNEKIIIPTDYNSITTDMIVTRGNKYGILNMDNSTMIPIAYDSIQYIQGNYLLQKNKKYGLAYFDVDNRNLILLDCNSRTLITGWKKFRINFPVYKPYIVFECKDANGNLIGYYDKKGFPYF
jgi:WG containing repeat